MRFLLENLFAFFLRVIVATAVSVVAYSWKWWGPTISFPLIMILCAYIYKPFSLLWPLHREILKLSFYLTATAFLISQVIVFQVNIGSWYGWLLGVIIGLSWGGVMAGSQQDWQGFKL